MKKTNNIYHLHIELREGEHQKMLEDVKKSGLTKSTYIRKLIKEEKVKARPTSEISELYTEVNRIGNNINQIARSVNTGITSSETTAEQALFLLRKVYDLMEKVADQ